MKSVFGFRVRLGNPDLDFENLNPDFPIERTLNYTNATHYCIKDSRLKIKFSSKRSQVWRAPVPVFKMILREVRPVKC